MSNELLQTTSEPTGDSSTSYPCLSDFERRFSKTDIKVKTKTTPAAEKQLPEGAHMCITVKNPRTLLDLKNWAHRDLFEFAA